MNRSRVIVIVPIYKSIPNEKELLSLQRCIDILGRYEICFVTFKELDVHLYASLFATYNLNFSIQLFDQIYFTSAAGYNKLLLTLDFYKSFKCYEYMFIYQLDAYVFTDDLERWCNKGYDLIGAPLIEDKFGEEKKYFLNHFNGGFTLRKIDYCIRLLSYKGPLLKPKLIFRITKAEFKDNVFKRVLYFILRSLGRQNNIQFLIQKTPINEDLLLSLGLFVSWINCSVEKNEAWIYPNLPSNEEATEFAFERYPSYLYGLNNNKLPMGCHAWEKYEFDLFWHQFIKL